MDALNLGADRYLQKRDSPMSVYGVLANAIAQEVDHRRTKKDYRRDEKELSAMMKNLPITVMLVDRDLRVRKINDTGLEFSRGTEDEVIGRRVGKVLDCLHRSDDPRGCGHKR